MRIVINGIPPSLNRFAGRGNVWEYREAKERWKRLVYLSCKKPKRAYRRAVVGITYYFPDRRRRDPDNYAGKMILDGLTERGVLEDDSFSNIELVLRGRYDRERPRTEIEVTEKVE